MILLFTITAVLFAPQIESGDVLFNAPNFIRKEIMYSLIFNNPNPGQKFPVDNFAFAFELLKTKNVLSIADVSNLNYIGEDYHGFSIKDFMFKKDSIEMKLTFRKEAHGSLFRVRYVSASTEDEKVAFYGKSSSIGVIFHRDIEMLLPYTIVMQSSVDNNEIATSDRSALGHYLLPHKNGQILCNATEGLPDPKPEFVNSRELFDSSVIAVTNEITKIIWPVKINDHGKVIQCRAGNDLMNITLNVYHYMTNVTTSPQIDEKIQPGSQVKCISNDGYPVPKTFWVFLSGPMESSPHYELRDNDATLFVNYSAPLNSNWTFECSASFSMPTVAAKYFNDSLVSYSMNRTFHFSISELDNLNNSMLQSTSSAAGTVVALLLVIILSIAIAVVGYVKRKEIKKFIDATQNRLYQRTGQTANNSRVENTNRLNGTERGSTQNETSEEFRLMPPNSPQSQCA